MFLQPLPSILNHMLQSYNTLKEDSTRAWQASDTAVTMVTDQ